MGGGIDDIVAPFRAVAETLIEWREEEADTKYSPPAQKERRFKELIDEGDFNAVLVSRLPANHYGAKKELDGVETLIVDTEEIPEEILTEFGDLFHEAFESGPGISFENRRGIAPAVTDKNSRVDEVYTHNEGRIPSRLRPVLEEALVLRSVERRMDLAQTTIYEWRGEIASNYEKGGGDFSNAQTFISLCSTGYFDVEAVFDEMYDQLVVQGDYSLQEFVEIVADYIRDNPFAVFVRADGNNPKEIAILAERKLDQIEEYPASPRFVDICGKGSTAHQKIDNARDLLQDGDFEMETEYNNTIDQKILQLFPEK
ncbi:hypothetical protein [Halobacterium salinarum]|uniref:hypothetical protein n=1 Tax=Halobacterium salinarum TaxID=2242 RepID=UPI002554AE59|nr:hypothetical protein [Halobacterium salinarum]MDL0122853.1 hypothetical protein [Halobacterium salinarum]